MHKIPFRLKLYFIHLTLFSIWFNALSQDWQAVPLHFNYPPRCVAKDNFSGMTYVGGNFSQVNGVPSQSIIATDGQNLFNLGSDFLVSPVLCISINDGYLYAGGFNGIGAWDGNRWYQVATDGPIGAIRSYGDAIIFGGLFNEVENEEFCGLAMYKDGQLHDVFGSQQYFRETNNSVNAIEEFQGNLYIAGNIDGFGSMKEIMMWDGHSWSDVGGGMGSGGSVWINDMQVFKDELYVAGKFFVNHGAPGNCVAKWNGNRWQNVGMGFSGEWNQVENLSVVNDQLFASGHFEDSIDTTLKFIAFWNESEWCNLGIRLDNVVLGMSKLGKMPLMIGGFQKIGSDSVRFIATMDKLQFGFDCTSTNYENVAGDAGKFSLYPNPTNSSFTLTLPANTSTCTLKIHDVTGREVAAPLTYRAGDPPVDVSHLSAGLYFVEVRVKDRVEVVKLVKE